MSRVWRLAGRALLAVVLVEVETSAWAQEAPTDSEVPTVESVEVSPRAVEAEVGQKIRFTAVAKDLAGRQVNERPLWFAVPYSVAGADKFGTVTLYYPGEVRVGAVIGGKIGYATITVKPPPVVHVDIDPLTLPVVVGGTVQLRAIARTSKGLPRTDVAIAWTSGTPSVATVDAAGLVTGVAPGRARLWARSGEASSAVRVEVVEDIVRSLSVEPRSVEARTGDVVHFTVRALGNDGTQVKNLSVRWAASGGGATVESDGGFVAEHPGTYVVIASVGLHVAVASAVVAPRNVEREIEVVGRAPVKGLQAAEQWVIGNYAYLSSVADKVMVYDISDPAKPTLVDTLTVDARLINDVSITPDGRIGVFTREGASTRKNGIVFMDTTDPAHPKIISQYTQTVTGGVHSAFVDGHYVYLTDDATGSLRVIDFQNINAPKEVARWQIEDPMAQIVEGPTGPRSAGRFLHDVYVKDGLAYLAYFKDGLVILDVGTGIKGGSPENPQFVSQLRFNHHELYGPGWLAGTHGTFRYKNYVFVGDEVFPTEFDCIYLLNFCIDAQVYAETRIPVRGIVHVVDVSDIEHPRKVAEYSVPEAGAHNFWVEDDVLYAGYLSGGGRVLDVSGELRGDLYRQGREIARLWTGDPTGFYPNLPFSWGAQPHRGLIFFNDSNTGLWIVRLGKIRFKGSTTEPPK